MMSEQILGTEYYNREEPNMIRASQLKRFLNLLVDVIVFYIAFMIFAAGLMVIIPDQMNQLLNAGAESWWLDRVLGSVFYALFMGTVESISGGRSLGKLFTGTKAVNLDGTEISTQTAFLRGLCRAVPFCVFSAFGTPCNPWQDKWTDTMVIDLKASSEINPWLRPTQQPSTVQDNIQSQ